MGAMYFWRHVTLVQNPLFKVTKDSDTLDLIGEIR
jgi:hypothetical protein